MLWKKNDFLHVFHRFISFFVLLSCHPTWFHFFLRHFGINSVSTQTCKCQRLSMKSWEWVTSWQSVHILSTPSYQHCILGNLVNDLFPKTPWHLRLFLLTELTKMSTIPFSFIYPFVFVTSWLFRRRKHMLPICCSRECHVKFEKDRREWKFRCRRQGDIYSLLLKGLPTHRTSFAFSISV